MAGLPIAIASTLNDHALSFLNRASSIVLEPLRIRDVQFYYESAFSELQIRLDPSNIREAARASEGSPYLMQLIGHYIAVSADKTGDVSEMLFDAAIDAALRDFKKDICETTLAPLSERDIAFLLAMAEDVGDSRLADVAARMRVTDAYVQTYKRRLVQAGVIRQPRRGVACMEVPYLRDYLREDYQGWV
jgi:hypothetical protein